MSSPPVQKYRVCLPHEVRSCLLQEKRGNRAAQQGVLLGSQERERLLFAILRQQESNAQTLARKRMRFLMLPAANAGSKGI